MRYAVIIEEDKLDGGYVAYVPNLKGCFTQADTLDELKTNIIEAIELSQEEEPVNSIFGIWELEINKNATASHY
ncbi:MAG: type II toxin-antitoxin system HicB family antitoxin [Campylobacterales bacterium]|nr:type II toxin-antitoxin system HicB family antitoxin [Campylobacterales bacterium]